MMPRPTFLPALLPLLGVLVLGLAGCATDDPPTPSAPRSTASAAPRAPTGPVTSFDGRYSGQIKLNPDRTRQCPQAPAQDLTLTLRDGRGTFLVNPATRQTLSGTVGQNGDIRLADPLDRTIATSGVFTEQGFVGEYRNGLCNYAVHLRKAA